MQSFCDLVQQSIIMKNKEKQFKIISECYMSVKKIIKPIENKKVRKQKKQ